MRDKAKKFDCLEMKRAVQRKVWTKLKGMSADEQLAYWQKRHLELENEKQGASGPTG